MLPLLYTATTAYFTTLRLRTYLHAFQQEEYDNPRFLKWYAEKRAFDRYATLGLLIGLPFAYLQPQATYLIIAFWLAYRIRKEPDPTTSGKKSLVLTTRASHIWWCASAFPLFAIGFLSVGNENPLLALLGTIVLIQSLPLFLTLANTLLRPIQAIQNKKYLRQAEAVLAQLKPTTIGITGSFGKTSTKYILNHILASQSPTLATPGSVNTPLGIARIIREQLNQSHQYFISEMGAYAPGSIARLCRLTPPQISCITAVGMAHYERFKSLETVAKTKFEIAEATLKNGGICILNADGIPDDLWKPRVEANPTAYRLVTTRVELLRENDYHLENVNQSATGLTLTIRHHGQSTTFSAPVYGMVQSGNLAVAFAMAQELGLSPKSIASAMATVKPAPYRLNIQHNGTVTTIDDSYNANPAGLTTALETLTLIANANPSEPRRRILLTPGMVELGAAHDTEHTRLGHIAAQHADVILVVNPQRIPTFTDAINADNHPALYTFPSLAAARQWLATHSAPHDVILIANDLPDRYESRWSL